MKCEICSEEISKYKCPKCLIKYCSVACYKTHSSDPETCKLHRKRNVPEIEPTKSAENRTGNENAFEEIEMTEDQILPAQLQNLESSSEMKNILANRHLREMLVQVNNSTQIGQDIEKAMQEPIFCEFASKCLEIVKKDGNSTDAPNLQLPQVKDIDLPK